MLFNSFYFLFAFLPVVFIIYFLTAKFKPSLSNLWLLLSSLYFYAYYKIEYLPIIIISILFNYTIGYFIQKDLQQQIKKYLLFFAITGNLALLSYYKYFNFLIDTLNSFNFAHFNLMKLMLPLGISFFTFQQIGYIIDLYKKEAKHVNITDYALFVSFFPQLIAGPICTFKELMPQFKDNAKKVINRDNIYKGLFFIILGLCKKTLFADNFTDFIQGYILNGTNEFFSSYLFALSIAMQGYFDFSGYCDMALGIAALFNIDIPINFNSPYKSIDISEYWRRWHITLGRFLKYYVYIPLGGSRCGEVRTYFNLFFVFLIVGIWHGANWCCILYGIFNGILVCINKFIKKIGIVINNKLSIFITFITLVFLAPLMIFKELSGYFNTVKSMLGINSDFIIPKIQNLNFIFNADLKLNILLLISSFIIVFCFKNTSELAPLYVKTKSFKISVLLAVIFVISLLSITERSEFIYFNF